MNLSLPALKPTLSSSPLSQKYEGITVRTSCRERAADLARGDQDQEGGSGERTVRLLGRLRLTRGDQDQEGGSGERTVRLLGRLRPELRAGFCVSC